MKNTGKTQITKDAQERSILVSRVFDAPIEKVWQAYTESELLDQWWGPSPWKAETKSMNFKEGGYWLYAMVGPENEKQWSRMNYQKITPYKSIDIEDAFSDENGDLNRDMPIGKGKITFTQTTGGVKVDFKSIYPSEADLDKLVEMGFEQGISVCYDQLDNLLKEIVHAHQR